MVVRYLLLPDDEKALADWLHSEHGLVRLLDDSLQDGNPTVAPNSEGEWPSLPTPPVPFEAGPIPTEFLFWHERWGVNNLESVADMDSARQRVLRLMEDQSLAGAGLDRAEFMDFQRSRVICFHRSGWIAPQVLHVAAMDGSARPKAHQDEDVLRVLRSADRWLRKDATRVELPDHVQYRPAVFARPGVLEYLAANGIEIYPYDA